MKEDEHPAAPASADRASDVVVSRDSADYTTASATTSTIAAHEFTLLDRWRIMLLLSADRRVTHAMLAVALVLLDRWHRKFGTSMASIRYLAKATGMHRTTVHAAVRSLIEHGIFSADLGKGTAASRFKCLLSVSVQRDASSVSVQRDASAASVSAQRDTCVSVQRDASGASVSVQRDKTLLGVPRSTHGGGPNLEGEKHAVGSAPGGASPGGVFPRTRKAKPLVATPISPFDNDPRFRL